MQSEVYRYEFADDVPMEEVEARMVLALLNAEFLHGEIDVQLKGVHFLDCEKRVCVVDASTDVGQSLSRLFAGYVRREFGPDAFSVRRVQPESRPTA